MYAIRLHAFGPPENLVHEDAAPPRPGAEEVLVRVEAAGVHVIDARMRAGIQMGPAPLPALPVIPGREVAGVVEAVGDDVGASWAGRRVVAHLGAASGGYAELTVAPVAALHAIPAGLGAPEAVAAIGTGRTALGILEAARIREIDTVVIPAAAGGVGALLVQGALAAGAQVVALVGGPDKVARVKDLGATWAFDYTDDGWSEAVRHALDGSGVSLVLDGVGGDVGRVAFELLGLGGRMVVFGWSSGSPTALTTLDVIGRGVVLEGALARMAAGPGGLRRLEAEALDAFATGRLRPLVHAPFALADAATAHAALEARETAGKVVLIP